MFKLMLFIGLQLGTAAAALPPLKGHDLVSGKDLSAQWDQGQKGTVVVFLSSLCPCSNAHIPHLTELKQSMPEINFIGVHSNANETEAHAGKYFASKALPFPVIQDTDGAWADRLKAYRTPHAFLVSPQGEILYQGGVTSSANPSRADAFYLKVTLSKFLAGEKIETERTRVLGCAIARR